MATSSFITFGAPDIHEEEIQEVTDSLRSGWIGTGPKVAKFEKLFADYKGVREFNVVAVNSCTAALHLSMIASGVGPGDEVITTPMTFCATVNAIIHSGATPVLADVDLDTMNISPKEIVKQITSRTKAIVPVHFAGRPCDMDMIYKIAYTHNLKIIEDCAHAIESQLNYNHAGTFGDFGCFSFYVTKNITTAEGGMVITRDPEAAARIKRLALHGMSNDAWRRFMDTKYNHYKVEECGYKYNMTDLQASIGIHQLKRINDNLNKRNIIWDLYQEAFKDHNIGIPKDEEANTVHAKHLYTLLFDKEKCGIERDDFLHLMSSKHNIGVGVHYLSIPEHPYYRKRFGWKPTDYPNAYKIGRQTASIPLSPKLNAEEIYIIIEAVFDCIC
jgi:dTDP-4-amino-4,6-dideoxygalactose transaminase